jgi:hypothetical protein
MVQAGKQHSRLIEKQKYRLRHILVMGNPVWQCGPLLEVAVLNVAETVTQPYFGLYCLQLHHSFNAKVL